MSEEVELRNYYKSLLKRDLFVEAKRILNRILPKKTKKNEIIELLLDAQRGDPGLQKEGSIFEDYTIKFVSPDPFLDWKGKPKLDKKYKKGDLYSDHLAEAITYLLAKFPNKFLFPTIDPIGSDKLIRRQALQELIIANNLSTNWDEAFSKPFFFIINKSGGSERTSKQGPGGYHWVLVLIDFNIKSMQKIWYVDSMGGTIPQNVLDIIESLYTILIEIGVYNNVAVAKSASLTEYMPRKHIRIVWKTRESAPQKKSEECGVYCIWFIWAYSIQKLSLIQIYQQGTLLNDAKVNTLRNVFWDLSDKVEPVLKPSDFDYLDDLIKYMKKLIKKKDKVYSREQIKQLREHAFNLREREDTIAYFPKPGQHIIQWILAGFEGIPLPGEGEGVEVREHLYFKVIAWIAALPEEDLKLLISRLLELLRDSNNVPLGENIDKYSFDPHTGDPIIYWHEPFVRRPLDDEEIDILFYFYYLKPFAPEDALEQPEFDYSGYASGLIPLSMKSVAFIKSYFCDPGWCTDAQFFDFIDDPIEAISDFLNYAKPTIWQDVTYKPGQYRYFPLPIFDGTFDLAERRKRNFNRKIYSFLHYYLKRIALENGYPDISSEEVFKYIDDNITIAAKDPTGYYGMSRLCDFKWLDAIVLVWLSQYEALQRKKSLDNPNEPYNQQAINNIISNAQQTVDEVEQNEGALIPNSAIMDFVYYILDTPTGVLLDKDILARVYAMLNLWWYAQIDPESNKSLGHHISDLMQYAKSSLTTNQIIHDIIHEIEVYEESRSRVLQDTPYANSLKSALDDSWKKRILDAYAAFKKGFVPKVTPEGNGKFLQF